LLARRSSSKISRGLAKVNPCGRPSARAMSWMIASPARASPGRIDRLVDLDDAPFDLRHRPFVLFLQAAGQARRRRAGRVVEEEIDGDVELELVEAARDEAAVGQRHLRVEADRQQPLISPASIFRNSS
jgi:hypothetical protein